MSSVVKNLEILAGPWAIILPKNTPDEILNWYAKVFSEAVNTQKMREYFDQNYFFVESNLTDPIKFKAYVLEERKKHKPVVKTIVESMKK
jgi:tripartite-type tricarboxylate transporter receptor subunit TctC